MKSFVSKQMAQPYALANGIAFYLVKTSESGFLHFQQKRRFHGSCWGGILLRHPRMESKPSNTSKDGDLNYVEVLVPGENKSEQDNANTNASIKRTRNHNVERFPSKKYRKDGNLSSAKPPQNSRHDAEVNRKSSRVRTAATPFQPENSSRKKGQENDGEELKLAAASARDARRQKACSHPFWEQMETLFAPITPEDLLLLKQPRPYEVHSGIQSQVSNDEREAQDVIPKDNACTERSLLEQGSVNSATNVSKSSTVPSLFQRTLAALIDEDEIEHMEGIQSEDISKVSLQSNDNIRIDDASEAENTRSETDQHMTMLGPSSSNEQCQADDGARYMREYNLCKVLDLPLPKKVKMPMTTSLPDHEYQTLSLDDKLMLEFQSFGLNLEMLPQPEETEGLIEREIKELEKKLHQQGSAIKEKLARIEKAVEHEQDLEKRTTEEAPLHKLVEVANRKLPAWRKNRYAKNPCSQKNLAFIERTLLRCKEFEQTGKSCFSILNPQDTMVRTPPCTTDKENVQLNRVIIASTDSTEPGNRGEAFCSAPSTSVSGGTIEKTKRKRGVDKPPSTPLQTPVPNTDRACSSHSSETSTNQDLITTSKNNEKVVEEEEEDESDREITRLIRSTKRKKKTTPVLASCSSTVTPAKKHDKQTISSSNTPSTEKQDEQPTSSSKTRPPADDNIGDNLKELEDVTGSNRPSIEVTDADIRSLGEEDGLLSIFEYIDESDRAMELYSGGLDVPMDDLCDVNDALWNGWR